MKQTKEVRICRCGGVFIPKKSNQKYCSHKCGQLANPYYVNRKFFTKVCLICNNSFLTPREHQKYCSKACYIKANRTYMQRNRKINNTPFLKLRFQVFTRDKFRCQYCGRSIQDGIKLVVDHILAKASGGLDEIANLITACEDCNVGKSDIMLSMNQEKQDACRAS